MKAEKAEYGLIETLCSHVIVRLNNSLNNSLNKENREIKTDKELLQDYLNFKMKNLESIELERIRSILDGYIKGIYERRRLQRL